MEIGAGLESKKLPPLGKDGEVMLDLFTGGDVRAEKAEGFGACCCGAGDEKFKVLNASLRPPKDCEDDCEV